MDVQLNESAEPEAVSQDAVAGADSSDVVATESAADDSTGDGDSVRDALERAIQGSDEETVQAKTAAPETEDRVVADELLQPSETVAKEAPVSQQSKAPVDWSPKERELWSKIPSDIQARIKNREADIAQQLQGSAEARKVADRVQGLAQSYAPIMAAEGVSDPLQAVEGLFQVASGLHTGSPQQKARVVADIVKDYGIDINMLDSALVGQAPQGPSQTPHSPDIEHLIDQKMAPINQVMQQLNQLHQGDVQRQQAQANQSIQEFSQQAEFFNDVRYDMADFIDMAAKNGREMSLQEAYDRACALNPEISKVIDDRKQTAAIVNRNQSMQSKRAAASSIQGSKIGTGSANGSGGLRGILEEAWDDSYQ